MRGFAFKVDVLVGKKPLPVFGTDGKQFVPFKVGDVFSLRLGSDAPFDVKAIVAIDGQNVLDDSKRSTKKSPGYLIRPGATTLVEGWRTGDREVAQFLVKPVKKPTRGTVSTKAGQIDVKFFSGYDRGPTPGRGRVPVDLKVIFGPKKKSIIPIAGPTFKPDKEEGHIQLFFAKQSGITEAGLERIVAESTERKSNPKKPKSSRRKKNT